MASREPGWDLYRSFLAVLEEGSLSGAARALDLTQPTVGRHVDALEAALGEALFTRSAHGLEPTDAAQALRPHAEAIAAEAAALLRKASGRRGVVQGTVRITASEVIGVEVLPPILAALRRTHPGLVLELALTSTVEDLLRREADIAVRMVAPKQEALLARRIGDVMLGLHARRDYLDRCGVPDSLAALHGHTLIGFDRETAAVNAMRRRISGLDREMFALRADSDLAQLAAIRAGFGIGVCQVPLAARDPSLARVLGGEFALPLPCWVAMHEAMARDPRCRVVFDALVRGLSDYLRDGV
ncbi:LysR family transcriptional regulator [Roseomonas sp. HJA6]|uniref:LysR family transcriptional regulator n=1 Tax=Roseomonas alba TaxID=2846776 RepID=A0ABS7A247_9PROT|nr:LysR family transcriptional regulator [Neoroseomonas alba]MBW6396355.1 LysR family transcriptional regulator [Neoroseomonas alba]